jgi:hypothetical protein
VQPNPSACRVLKLWLPPCEQRAGGILLIDFTQFATRFGSTDSLANSAKSRADELTARKTPVLEGMTQSVLHDIRETLVVCNDCLDLEDRAP